MPKKKNYKKFKKTLIKPIQKPKLNLGFPIPIGKIPRKHMQNAEQILKNLSKAMSQDTLIETPKRKDKDRQSNPFMIIPKKQRNLLKAYIKFFKKFPQKNVYARLLWGLSENEKK